MGNEGYIYVLINPAMQGMAKVGKTTRNPQDRIDELSGVTGVPTPFVLVYKEFFADCSFAETYIHTILEDKGYRVSENREFFNGALDEIIKTVQSAKLKLNNEFTNEPKDKTSSDLEDDYSYGIFKKAEAYYYGRNDRLQDYQEALSLFKKAIKLGDIKSYLYLGWMYRNGDGCSEDMATALNYFKEGSSKKNNYCNAEMGMIFIAPYYNNVHMDNGKKCWELYFKNLNINKTSNADIRYFNNYIELVGAGLLPLQNIDILSFNKYRMLAALDSSLSYYIEDSALKFSEYHIERLNNNKNYIEENLNEPQKTIYEEDYNNLSMEIVDIQIIDDFPNKTFFSTDVHRGILEKGQKVTVIGINNEEIVLIEAIYSTRGFVDDCFAGEKNVTLSINGTLEQNKIIREGNFIIDIQ